MKTRRYSEAQIFRILKEVDDGCPVVDAARNHGVLSPLARRSTVKHLVGEGRCSQRRACAVVRIPRSLARYTARIFKE